MKVAEVDDGRPTLRELMQAVKMSIRERQSLECAEDQARQWNAAWDRIRAERPDADGPSEWNW